MLEAGEDDEADEVGEAGEVDEVGWPGTETGPGSGPELEYSVGYEPAPGVEAALIQNVVVAGEVSVLGLAGSEHVVGVEAHDTVLPAEGTTVRADVVGLG